MNEILLSSIDDIQYPLAYRCLRVPRGSSGRLGYSGIVICFGSSKCTISDSLLCCFDDEFRTFVQIIAYKYQKDFIILII